jgi:ADP-ribose pyrophosphatase YjhB (NUDIX family)
MAFAERDGLYLVLRRADEPFAGRWDLPGGFVEAGESPQDCIRRELREETGLELDGLGLIGVYCSRYGNEGRHTVDVGYQAYARSGEVRLSEEKSEAAWVSLDQMPDLAFDGERAALADLRAALSR